MVSVPPAPVTIPFVPEKVPTYRLFVPMSQRPPLSVKALLPARSRPPLGVVRVPALIVVVPV